MANALDVANYLIFLANSGAEPDHLTQLRLQKLLYYVQGWSLALRGQPMFPDRIEAWAHGPLVPNVYKHFSDMTGFLEIKDVPDLADKDKEFIDEVWEAYKDFSALKLREMTRRESPWRNARNGCGPAEVCKAEIPQGALRDFFSRKAKAKV